MDDVVVFHGSKDGIKGDIIPKSRIRCDFGSGFYMGDNSNQVLSFVSNSANPVFYECKLLLSQIPDKNIVELDGFAWAYFVAYNRGKFEDLKGTPFYHSLENLAKGKDFIIGPIADDNMNEVINRFLKYDITDVQFTEAIKALDYGKQYVAKTEKACKSIQVISSKHLTKEDKKMYLDISVGRRKKANALANKIILENRRKGRYLDEIVAEYLKPYNDNEMSPTSISGESLIP